MMDTFDTHDVPLSNLRNRQLLELAAEALGELHRRLDDSASIGDALERACDAVDELGAEIR